MKMNREHIVPLSDEALAILEMMKPLNGAREYVFPSRIKPTQSMNSQTVNAALKRAGLGGVLVSHGLRSIASTAPTKQPPPAKPSNLPSLNGTKSTMQDRKL